MIISLETGSRSTPAAATTAAVFGLAFLAVMSPVVAAEPEAAPGVTVTKWASGLAGPQGMALDDQGNVLVVEHDAGRVSRFSRTGDAPGRKGETLAEGLASPSFALRIGKATYIAERKGNSIARLGPDAALTRLEGEIIDPLGIAIDPKRPGALLAVSHRQSQVRVWTMDKTSSAGKLTPKPLLAPPSGAKYGWRDLLVMADGSLLVTDEVARAVLRRKPGGQLVPFASELSSPSGLSLSPAGVVFVTEEGTGQLTRLDAEGKGTMVARGLGAAREALFLDATTVLVSDRKGGDIWQVNLGK
jgi:glucose/arabinose dehydrogenase